MINFQNIKKQNRSLKIRQNIPFNFNEHSPDAERSSFKNIWLSIL